MTRLERDPPAIAIRQLDGRIFAYEPIVKTVTGSQLVLPNHYQFNIYKTNRRLSTGDDANI